MGSYTKEELQSAIREQEEKLAVLQLDLKEAELKIQNAEKAVQNGVVRAKISGIVKKAGNPDSPAGRRFCFSAGDQHRRHVYPGRY